jgi:hypothetical protein
MENFAKVVFSNVLTSVEIRIGNGGRGMVLQKHDLSNFLSAHFGDAFNLAPLVIDAVTVIFRVDIPARPEDSWGPDNCGTGNQIPSPKQNG